LSAGRIWTEDSDTPPPTVPSAVPTAYNTDGTLLLSDCLQCQEEGEFGWRVCCGWW
jgi:hypothetical protein